MLVLLGLLYIFFIFFISGWGIAYYIFKRTEFEKYFFLFAPLVGICITIASISILTETGLPFSFLILLPFVCGALITTLVLWRKRIFIRQSKALIRRFVIILFFALLGGILTVLPQALTNQYGYFHFGNDELMYYSGRASLVMADGLQKTKVEQFDRFGTLLYLSTISFYLQQAPSLVAQLAQGVARAIFVFVCFGVAEFLQVITFKRKTLNVLSMILLGTVLVFSAVEYEHFMLDYLAAQTNMGIFLVLLLITFYPTLLQSRKLTIFISFIFAVLVISYPEMALLIAALLAGSLSLQGIVYFLANLSTFGQRSFFNKQTRRTIASWLFLGIWFVFLLSVLSGKNGLWMYFNYASRNSVDYAIGESVLGSPGTDLPQFLARIMGMQFLDFMPVNTLPGYALVVLGIGYLIFLGVLYGKIAMATGVGILIIPICFIYVTIKGAETGNYYQLAKMVFYTNSFALLLWFVVKYKTRLQVFSVLFLLIFVIGNAAGVYRHAKYYIITQIPLQFFSAAQVNALQKEVENRRYSGVVINSPWYALWEFFYQNGLPIKKQVIQEQVFVGAIYEFVKKPEDRLFITFPHWANRFLDISVADQKLGSVWVLRPETFKKNVTPLLIDATSDIEVKTAAQLLDDGKLVVVCQRGTKNEATQAISTKNLRGKLLLITANVSAEQADQARIQLTANNTKETVRSNLYAGAGFHIDLSLSQEKLLQTIKESSKYMGRLGISYRVSEKTEFVDLKYVVSGIKPGCAVFEDMDILVFSRL